ncbi:sensor histidine kinase [Dyella sp. A6]|uniref:sensor histidine kinase n=1 Tax=Dyella aluminiiresistens TaxID=3069105 RepID=UPI002E7879FD|nr:ATP-binding protein [Dyella sp. A6]
MQLLLICVGCFAAVNKVVMFSQPEFRAALSNLVMFVDAFTDVMIVVAAWVSLFFVRRGEFRKGVSLFLGVMLASGLLAYTVIGLRRLYLDPFPLLLLGLAGLMLGRRALWTVFGILMLWFGLGTLSDAWRDIHAGVVHWKLSFRPTVEISYLAVALVLDRAIGALRETLAVSEARGEQLERTNRQLQHEMVERERTMEHLVHAQKMEAVGRVASGVAHDFDNILGVILGYTARRERLADGGVAPLVNAMAGIHAAAERAAMISRQLLGFSRHDVTRVELLDLREIMQTVCPMMKQLFGAHIRMSIEQPEEPSMVAMDRAQLELILLSVASNARDAMPDGGDFDIVVRRGRDQVLIELSDNGVGIAPGRLEHIFEPFYTTKPVGSGTGLGLSVVHDVLDATGGGISVRSIVGKGTTFVMMIPLAEQQAGQDVATQAMLSPAANR